MHRGLACHTLVVHEFHVSIVATWVATSAIIIIITMTEEMALCVS